MTPTADNDLVSDHQLHDLIAWHERDGTKKGVLTTAALRELLAARTSTAPVAASRHGYQHPVRDEPLFRIYELGGGPLLGYAKTEMEARELCARLDGASPPPPQPGVRVTEALRKVREAIIDPINNCSVIDTVWMPGSDGMVPIETLIDFIDAALTPPAS